LKNSHFGNYHIRLGDNVAMDVGVQIAAEIIDAIRSGRDVYVHDQILEGPDRLEHARKILFERLAACSDPDEAALLARIISGLEKSAP
jgi:hypothetical protein